MDSFIRFVGPNSALEIGGVRMVGMTPENGGKLLVTLGFVAAILLLGRALRAVSAAVLGGRGSDHTRFWTRQGINLFVACLLLFGLLSIWFDDPTRLATALGLVSAGLAFALQKVVTAVAGYFVILRGKTFNVGDRIVMGGVRGDVVALGFTQTTIMEMGQPPAVSGADPAVWVQSRQFTGRVVTVSNAKVFDEPVYNYTREFPYIWEEMTIPIPYTADRGRGEQILLAVARRHAVAQAELDTTAVAELKRRYFLDRLTTEPKVYYRLTDNWLELSVRFVVRDHGVRDVKDAMSRDLLAALDEAGIGIASATFEIVGIPPLRIQQPTGQWTPPKSEA